MLLLISAEGFSFLTSMFYKNAGFSYYIKHAGIEQILQSLPAFYFTCFFSTFYTNAILTKVNQNQTSNKSFIYHFMFECS